MLEARSDEIASSLLDGEATQIHLTTRICYALDGVGAEVWLALMDGATRDSLINGVSARYPSERAVIGADVDAARWRADTVEWFQRTEMLGHPPIVLEEILAPRRVHDSGLTERRRQPGIEEFARVLRRRIAARRASAG